MNKKLLVALSLLLILSTYNFKNDNLKNTLNIKDILVDNNKILTKNEVETELSFLLDKNLFTLNSLNIQNELKKNSFIESFEIKKIYPATLKVKVFEKKPIAIIQDKKKKYLYSDNNELIIYDGSKEFDNLPLVFGKKKDFEIFFKNLKKIDFPLNQIKTYYFFEAKRWDLETKKGQIIKLPITNYSESLINFLKLKNQHNFGKYKIFDYRIKNQVILK